MTTMNSISTRNLRLTAAVVCIGILLLSFYHFDAISIPSRQAIKDAVVHTSTDAQPVPEDIMTTSPPDIDEEFRMSGDQLPTYADRYEFDTPLVTKASKVAVIIENRQLNTLIPLILHFAAVLGPSWPIILYTSIGNVEYYEKTPSFLRMRYQIQVRALPENELFHTHDSVSAFLTKPWIWEELAPAKWVFMFQADSIICGNSIATVDDFLGYDLVGAPIREGLGRGYNGGLSLRNRELLLQIVNEYDWSQERDLPPQGDGYNYHYEDQWFAMRLGKMPEATLPTAEVAQTFSVETIWAEQPVGFHQVSRWLGSHMGEVTKWCPEIALAIGATFG